MATIQRIAKVLVSFSEEWEIDFYVARYLHTRRLAGRVNALEILLECLERYPGGPPYRKTDLDYFLDANFARTRSRGSLE
jgi:hypothetical protein